MCLGVHCPILYCGFLYRTVSWADLDWVLSHCQAQSSGSLPGRSKYHTYMKKRKLAEEKKLTLQERP